MKRCSKCKIFKPLDEFYNRKASKDGKAYWCKKCEKQYNEENKERAKQYYIDNKEEVIKRNKKWKENNKEKVEIYMKEYYLKYYLDNEEYFIEYQKQYLQTPQGKLTRKNSNHKRRLAKLGTDTKNKITMEQWDDILLLQNNKCIICNREFTEDFKPTMDHIIPLSKHKEFPDVDINSKDNIQALCRSCNSRKYTKLMSEL